jgi:hypothetical protein
VHVEPYVGCKCDHAAENRSPAELSTVVEFVVEDKFSTWGLESRLKYFEVDLVY